MRIALIGVCGLLAGCASSMVRSYPAGTVPSEKGLELVGEYGLATSKVLVTVTSAGGGGDKPKEDAAPPGVQFSSEITVNNAKAEPEEEEDKAKGGETDAPKLQTQAGLCGEIRKSYNDGRVAEMASYVRHAEFRSVVAGWLAMPPVDDKAKKAAYEKVDAFMARRAQDRAARRRALDLLELMPRCPQPVAVELKEVLEVASGDTYRLYATQDAMADNTLTVELESGYIKVINATADDRTADVIVEGAKSLGSIHALGRPLALAGAVAQADAAGNRALIEGALDRAVAQLRAEGFKPGPLRSLDAALVAPLQALKGAPLPPIDVDLPLKRTYQLSELLAGVNLDDALGISLKADCTDSSGDAIGRNDPAKSVEPRKPAAFYAGVLVPGERACTIVAVRTVLVSRMVNDAVVEQLEVREAGRLHFPASDATAASVYPVPRQAFVKTSSIYTFSGGRLAKSETVRPSPVVSFVSLPARVIGGFTGAVTDGIKGRSGVVDAETGRVESEIKRLQKARELQKLRDDADDDGDPQGGDTEEDAPAGDAS